MRERRRFESLRRLLPLYVGLGGFLFSVFAVFGGHRYAAASVLDPLQPDFDPARCPQEASVPWGASHAHPLIVVQATDLHVTAGENHSSKRNFLRFVQRVLPRFADVADAVVVTGDLVSSKEDRLPFLKAVLGYRSRQARDEWLWYNATAEAARATLGSRTAWITVPGNHDVFGSRSEYDAFGVYPPPPADGAASRVPQHRARRYRIREHTLLAIDATPFPPLHRPLNFFGSVDAALSAEVVDAFESVSENGAVVCLSHYPTSVLRAGKSFERARLAAQEGRLNRVRPAVLLSGHLHTLRGAFPGGIHAVARSGLVELQLPDLVDAAVFRVLVVDHGVPSWHDIPLRQIASGPLALILNPHEFGRGAPGSGFAALQSTHIRILVLEENEVSDRRTALQISAYVDGHFVGNATRTTGETHSMVYVVPWKPGLYSKSNALYKLDVFLRDGDSVWTVSRFFTMSGTHSWNSRLSVTFLANALLALSDFEKIAKVSVCAGLIFVIVGGLLVARSVLELRYYGVAWAVVSAWFLFGGPILIAPSLTEKGGFGVVTLYSMRAGGEVMRGSVDPFFAMFPVILFGVIPALYCCVALHCYRTVRDSKLVVFIYIFALSRCWSWCLNVGGAHGALAAICSPSCAPLSIFLTFSSRLHFEPKRKAS